MKSITISSGRDSGRRPATPGKRSWEFGGPTIKIEADLTITRSRWNRKNYEEDKHYEGLRQAGERGDVVEVARGANNDSGALRRDQPRAKDTSENGSARPHACSLHGREKRGVTSTHSGKEEGGRERRGAGMEKGVVLRMKGSFAHSVHCLQFASALLGTIFMISGHNY